MTIAQTDAVEASIQAQNTLKDGMQQTTESIEKQTKALEKYLNKIKEMMPEVKSAYSKTISGYYKAVSQGLLSYEEAKSSVAKSIEQKYGKEGLRALYEDMKKTYYAASEQTVKEMFKRQYGVEVPAMASGGIVKRPTLAMIGERGPEAVVPLQASGAGIDGTNITLNIYCSVGVKDIAEQLVREIRQRTGIRF